MDNSWKFVLKNLRVIIIFVFVRVHSYLCGMKVKIRNPGGDLPHFFISSFLHKPKMKGCKFYNYIYNIYI